nr:MAG TPA: hypothetical protein [Caudoviricetes sp.]
MSLSTLVPFTSPFTSFHNFVILMTSLILVC